MYRHDGKAIIVSNKDTWTIPFMVKGHVLASTEKVVLTVREVKASWDRYKLLSHMGDILYQKALSPGDLGIMELKDDGGTVVGFYACFTASVEESGKIPAGEQAYDLAVIDETAQSEWAYIPPTTFKVLEVLR